MRDLHWTLEQACHPSVEMLRYQYDSRNGETETLTEKVESINWESGTAPNFKSARRLRKQSVQSTSSPSLSSLLSPAYSGSRRESRSFQCGSKLIRQGNCICVTISWQNWGVASEPSWTIGTTKVPYADATTWGPGTEFACRLPIAQIMRLQGQTTTWRKPDDHIPPN